MNVNHRGFLFSSVVACVFIAGQDARGLVIDTLSAWNGTDNIVYFGEFHTATYGQTVTVGPESVLNSFTFVMDQLSAAPVRFRAHVMDWDSTQTRATGPVLFSSGNLQTVGLPGFETFTINTGNLALTTGNDYVLFFTTSNNFDGIEDSSAWAARNGSDVYAGGQFVYQHIDSFAALTTSPWTLDHHGTGYDLAFRAVFSNIPEPGALMLAGLGGMGLALTRRRRAPRPALA